MIQSQNEKVEVTVVEGSDGSECIALQVSSGGETNVLKLTPSQARLLATELIAAVNRAEVKVNLKSGTNMWRRSGESRPRLATAG